MVEATAVEPRGRITPADLGIWSDDHADALAPVAEFLTQHGAVPGIQLAHAGRKASTAPPAAGGGPLSPNEGGWTTIGPSGTPYPHTDGTTRTAAMDHDDIQSVIDAFEAAARRARDAGFRVAEVHGAHGYLLHEFLSPITNDRDDAYGGDFGSRVRLLREVTRRVQSVWPDDDPVFVRISATDWIQDRPSWTLEDSVRLAPLLADDGADLIDVSAGGIHPDQQLPETGPSYMTPYAERIKNETDCRVGAVGKITTAQQADAIIRNNRADLAVIGREHLRDPYFTLHAAAELDMVDRVEWPEQYRRARP